MLETIVWLNFGQLALTVSHVIFLFVFTLALCFLFSCRKKWWVTSCMLLVLTYMESWWTEFFFIGGFVVRFYWWFCCTVLLVVLLYPEYWIYYYSLWIGLFQLFVFVNYILCFFLCSFTSHGICIEHIYYLINLYFFVACVGHPKSILTWYLGSLSDFRDY